MGARANGGRDAALVLGSAALGALGTLWMAQARRRPRPAEAEPNRHTGLAQLNRTPPRRYYMGRNLKRAIAIEDLRAMAHRRLPRFALEYLEGGAEDEATLMRERTAFADWRFAPRTLVDVSGRTLATEILGKPAAAPLMVAPTGLNGVFWDKADIRLAQAAAEAGLPFVQSTMSNETMEDVAAAAPGLRHWWQLYVFGGDEVWQELIRRAEACGCEALVLTTNTQIFGNREWERRNEATPSRLSASAVADAAAHPTWLARTLAPQRMPAFKNVLDFVPRDQRGFFASAHWIRDHQPTSMSWDTVAAIRERWRRPFILKGILNLGDVRRAIDAGVDGVVLGSHGGRQLDWTVSALDLLPQARQIAEGKLELYVTGGIRRGTDLLKALALGAQAAMAGRAVLYGVSAAGREGAARALQILTAEARDSMGLLGAGRVSDLKPELLVHTASGGVPDRGAPPPAEALKTRPPHARRKTGGRTMAELDQGDRDRLSDRQYAFPKQRKEPLEDASHVRNAVARFDQVKGVSDAERDEAWKRIKAAAKKFDVKLEERSWRELGKPKG